LIVSLSFGYKKFNLDHETSKGHYSEMPGGLKHLTNQVQSLEKLIDDKLPSAWGRIGMWAYIVAIIFLIWLKVDICYYKLKR